MSDDLTAQELMALRLLAAGLTEGTAARTADISTRTLRRRLVAAQGKLQAATILQAAVTAGYQGLVVPDEPSADLAAEARRVFGRACGTAQAARRHYRNGEKPCGPCRYALNEQRTRRAAKALREGKAA